MLFYTTKNIQFTELSAQWSVTGSTEICQRGWSFRQANNFPNLYSSRNFELYAPYIQGLTHAAVEERNCDTTWVEFTVYICDAIFREHEGNPSRNPANDQSRAGDQSHVLK